ncbi:MAG TPA: hypothetical protein VNO70_12745 [Blastocatellia bacterium]|nr:hypothetical protein [Blastocatellia bacterium]
MRLRISLLVLLVAIALTGAFRWTGHGQATPRPAWEYKIVYNVGSEKRLDELGAQGWELAAIRTIVFQGSSTGGEYYFKRAR